LPVRNPDFSQSSELPLYKKGLRFYPKLQNILQGGSDMKDFNTT